MLRLVSLLGLICIVLLAWAISEDRRKVSWRIVAWGIGLQFAVGALVLNTPLRVTVFPVIDKLVGVLRDATVEGSKFVFGTLATDTHIGAIVAFQVLPVIIVVSALSAILYHLRVIQAVVYVIAVAMRRTLRLSGAEAFFAALQIFFGIECITAVRGYLAKMTRSELFVVMVTFMGSIAGSVMVVYTLFGAEAGHLATASLMTAPAGILIAKLMVPEKGEPATLGRTWIPVPVESRNVIDAAARGAGEGLTLALNVGAMLIAFVAIVYLANLACSAVTGLTFTQMVGWVFQPVAVLMGVPLHDSHQVGQLLGTKTVLNEFLAYQNLGELIKAGTISKRAATITTYALCGFANPGSLGILVSGLSVMIPERRDEIVALSLKSFLAGTLAAFSAACVAGILVYE